jgi:hypothetical protein
MDLTWNGYEFLFEIEKIRLLYGKYNYAAKTTEVRDDETRTIVATSIGPEVYGRDQQEVPEAARKQAQEWAEAR